MSYIGEFPEDFTTVSILFTTHAASGAPVAPSSGFEAADVAIFKNGSATEKTSTNGLTMTSPFNGTTGLHCLVIDTSNDTGDGGFWVAGAQYTVVLVPDETVDSLAVAKVIGTFGIELSEVLRPTTAGRQLDVSAGGEAGIDWANIGSPTTAVNLSGTNIDVDQVVASVSGAVGSVTGLTASNLDAAVSSRSSHSASDVWAVGTRVLTAGTNIALAKGTGVTGFNDLSAAQVNAEVDTALADYDAPTKAELDAAVSPLATAANLATVAGYIDTEIGTIITNLATVDTVVDAIKVSTDKLDDTVEDDGGTYRFTANALEQAPTGGSAPTASQVADEVQTRTIAAVTTVNGLAANSVTAAALATDAVTEIQTGLATASALSTVSGKIDVIDDFLDTEIAAILADTNELQTDWANGGRLDNILDARASQTSVDDLPTNAELATALGTADDAVLAQVALVKAKTDNLPSDPADQSLIIAATDAIKADTAAVKTKTDSLTFTVAGQADVNIASVNGVEVIGTGTTGDTWGPA